MSSADIDTKPSLDNKQRNWLKTMGAALGVKLDVRRAQRRLLRPARDLRRL